MLNRSHNLGFLAVLERANTMSLEPLASEPCFVTRRSRRFILPSNLQPLLISQLGIFCAIPWECLYSSTHLPVFSLDHCCTRPQIASNTGQAVQWELGRSAPNEPSAFHNETKDCGSQQPPGKSRDVPNMAVREYWTLLRWASPSAYRTKSPSF
jgi:hypothetical protein